MLQVSNVLLKYILGFSIDFKPIYNPLAKLLASPNKPVCIVEQKILQKLLLVDDTAEWRNIKMQRILEGSMGTKRCVPTDWRKSLGVSCARIVVL